jgi:hypothetical protein
VRVQPSRKLSTNCGGASPSNILTRRAYRFLTVGYENATNEKG